MSKRKNVLFLCTGNSARSILGEAIFNSLFASYGHAYSAGSRPIGQVNPFALETLKNHDHDVGGLHSKHVGLFSIEDAPIIDLVISVCDSAAQDCPVWQGRGQPRRLQWPLPDPASIEGAAAKAAAFENTYHDLKERITDLMTDSFIDNASKKRFEYIINGATVFANYRREGSTLYIDYVEAPSEIRGTGAAGKLMQKIINFARQANLKVVPICGYAESWMARNATL